MGNVHTSVDSKGVAIVHAHRPGRRRQSSAEERDESAEAVVHNAVQLAEDVALKLAENVVRDAAQQDLSQRVQSKVGQILLFCQRMDFGTSPAARTSSSSGKAWRTSMSYILPRYKWSAAMRAIVVIGGSVSADAAGVGRRMCGFV